MVSKTMRTYYKIKHLKPSQPNTHEKSVQITKFNADLDVESSYPMNYIESKGGGYYDCACPASKFDCRHKAILKAFEAHNQIDGDKFYCFETKTFHDMKQLDNA